MLTYNFKNYHHVHFSVSGSEYTLNKQEILYQKSVASLCTNLKFCGAAVAHMVEWVDSRSVLVMCYCILGKDTLLTLGMNACECWWWSEGPFGADWQPNFCQSVPGQLWLQM